MINEPFPEESYRYRQVVATLSESTDDACARAKKAEEELRETQAHLAKTQRLAHVGSWSWDFKKRKSTVSEEIYRILGVDQEYQTFSFEHLSDFLYPEDRQRVLGTVKAAIDRKSSFFTEFRIIRQDGECRYLTCDGDVEYDGAGQLTCIYGIAQDVTERRQAEEALRQSEERLRLCAATANFGVFELDMVKNLSYWSPETYEIFGVPQGTPVSSEYLQSLVFREDVDFSTAAAGMDPKGPGVFALEYRIRRASDGVVRRVSTKSQVCFSGEGPSRRAVRVLGVIQDITDRRLADEQLQASLKEQEALLKEVHHRVKNNLQIINSLLNLQSGEISDEHSKTMFLDSQNRVKSMALVHELLYRSKNLSSINLSEYLQSVAANIAVSYRHYASHVALRASVEDLNIDVDRAVPVGIIVTELLSNAYKYAFPDGRAGDIFVELCRDGDHLLLTIRDNGLGLPADFEACKDSSLGLQLVELLTEQLDGTLEVSQGDETTFKIRFAAAELA